DPPLNECHPLSCPVARLQKGNRAVVSKPPRRRMLRVRRIAGNQNERLFTAISHAQCQTWHQRIEVATSLSLRCVLERRDELIGEDLSPHSTPLRTTLGQQNCSIDDVRSC